MKNHVRNQHPLNICRKISHFLPQTSGPPGPGIFTFTLIRWLPGQVTSFTLRSPNFTILPLGHAAGSFIPIGYDSCISRWIPRDNQNSHRNQMVDDDFCNKTMNISNINQSSISLRNHNLHHITIHYCSDPAFKDAIILVSNRSCDFALLVRGKKEGAQKTGFHMIS